MQQFIVPQFIDVENKIIGPISTRQFIVLLADGMIIFVCYKVFSFISFLVIAVILLALGAMLAFVKVNGQPFHYFLLNIIQTLKRPRLRLWRKAIPTVVTELKQATFRILPARKQVSTSRLTELSLAIETGGQYHDEP